MRLPRPTSYQLGSIAFTIGTIVWGAQSWLAAGALDLAAAAYGIGCLYFLRDAFFPAPRGRLLDSYRLGSLAYAVGTVVWGVQVYRQSGRIDPAALTYGVGCLYFLKDAFDGAASASGPARSRPTSQQLGAMTFLVGTVIWAITGGVSIPVASYGLGCLFFLRTAFRKRLDVP